jgi:hypothetical protein
VGEPWSEKRSRFSLIVVAIIVAIFVDLNLCPDPRPDLCRSTMIGTRIETTIGERQGSRQGSGQRSGAPDTDRRSEMEGRGDLLFRLPPGTAESSSVLFAGGHVPARKGTKWTRRSSAVAKWKVGTTALFAYRRGRRDPVRPQTPSRVHDVVAGLTSTGYAPAQREFCGSVFVGLCARAAGHLRLYWVVGGDHGRRLCASWLHPACHGRISNIRQSSRQSLRQSFVISQAAGVRLRGKSPTRSNWPAKPARGLTEP